MNGCEGCFRAGYIESWGRGIAKILRACEEHGIEPPEYDFETAGVTVQFVANPDHLQDENGVERTTPKTTSITTSNETSDRILLLMRDNPTISLQELSDALDMTRDGVKYHIAKLKRDGWLQRIGSSRSGHWEVTQ